MQSSIASDQKLDRGQRIRLINRVCASLVIATSVYPPHAPHLYSPEAQHETGIT